MRMKRRKRNPILMKTAVKKEREREMDEENCSV